MRCPPSPLFPLSPLPPACRAQAIRLSRAQPAACPFRRLRGLRTRGLTLRYSGRRWRPLPRPRATVPSRTHMRRRTRHTARPTIPSRILPRGVRNGPPCRPCSRHRGRPPCPRLCISAVPLTCTRQRRRGRWSSMAGSRHRGIQTPSRRRRSRGA